MKNLLLYILLIIAICYSVSSPAYGNPSRRDSTGLQELDRKLDAAARADPAFQKEVDLSIGKISLPEMLRNIAKVSGVNLTIKGGENTMVAVNFNRAKVIDLLYYLCSEYGLDVDVVGNIVSVRPLEPPAPSVREVNVRYDSLAHTLSYDLSGESLQEVTKKIVSLSKHNLMVPQQVYGRKISGYAESMPFDDAIETLAVTNGLIAEQTTRGIWAIDADPELETGKTSRAIVHKKRFAGEELSVDSLGMVTARLNKAKVHDVIVELCERFGFNYFFLTQLNHETGIFVSGVEPETLFDVLLAGTNLSYYVDSGIYIFGSAEKGSDANLLTSVQIVPMISRTVNKVEEVIPARLKKEVQIQAFHDLNSMIVSGEQKQVSRVSNFIKSIDIRVPMITIEIMIVDVTKTKLVESGLGIGLGSGGKETAGTLSPGISMSLNSSSINNIISSFGGFGAINLGRVTPQFYMDIKMLEENGVLRLHSTPKLSTLNGQEATLKSGETRHYKEITNNYIGTQIPTITENFVWRSIDANLSIRIVPYVSLDNMITLEVEIEQTEFSKTQAEENTPPGTSTRSFKSIIKVENEEVVLLGGIDRNSAEKSAKGLPLIARIPVLRWIFGNSKNNKTEQQLSVFIKPTVTY